MTFATREPVHDLGFSFERLLFGLAPAVAMVLIGGLLVRQTLMPLRRLTRAAEHVGGDGAEEVPESGTREVRRLIGSFNRMQARIHRLIEDRTQALAAVGHDLRTPLARLRLRADAIKDEDVYQAMESDLTEMQAMIDSLLEYYGGDANGEAAVRIDLAVMCATIADDARDRGLDVRYAGPRHLNLTVRRSAIKRALSNLVENGLHYGKRVWITIEAHEEIALVRIEDDGPGIPEDSLEKVLQPFVRLDHARARDTVGLGLGLSIVKRTVDAERGTLRLTNREKGGLRAEICLPMV
jgi:signal transduction histidine kinase